MIRNIPPGIYELEVSLVGYEIIAEEVIVAANKTATVTLQLKISDKQLQAVIVRSGVKSYKSNIPSSTLRIQTPLLEMSQNIEIVTNKTLADQQIISMSAGTYWQSDYRYFDQYSLKEIDVKHIYMAAMPIQPLPIK